MEQLFWELVGPFITGENISTALLILMVSLTLIFLPHIQDEHRDRDHNNH
jgi:hypothetical protein